ncbi:hypothetical protein IW261DRAFT_1428575 [Armillaria novae-zelandiae]|uniref:Uncharacterized protein n=1 Tax=Armillaria novae-zelandiae TaxID=153914 RepID=A0AA39N9I5_9AGAR|nr:hypothetical protein IW261DRAFT_1428575 [Armillaria novae-zelandiae]
MHFEEEREAEEVEREREEVGGRNENILPALNWDNIEIREYFAFVVRNVLLSHYNTDLLLDNSAWLLMKSGSETTIMAMQQSRTFQLQDLLINAGDSKDEENLSVNDGRVGTYIEEHKIFITTLNGSFIPHPPTVREILLHEDGHFGHHDPTRAPQFFDAKFCHFSVIPHHPGPKDDTHPYRNWLDTILYDVIDTDIVYSTGYLTHIGLLSWEVVAMQSYWLELVAGLDYMEHYQPVMNGKTRRDDALNSSQLMGTFTVNLDVAEQHIRAGIPVYLVRPVDQFNNQVILKAEEPVVFPLNTSLSSPPFPVIYKGDPSHPQKFYAMHQFIQIFNTYRNPFNFVTISQPSIAHAERTQAAASSSSSISVATGHPRCNQRGKARALGPLASAQASRKKKSPSNQQWDKFTNLVGTYAPSLIPAWADAIAKIDKFSERSQECEEHSRLAQSQSNKEGPIAPSHVNGYVFPDPALLVYTSATQQSLFFHQWEHCRDALIYHVTSSSSNAKPLWPQLWHELLAMAFKSGNAQGTKVHDLMAQALGSALEAPGSGTTILQAPAPVSDQPIDIERGKYLVWELCELNFRQELLSLDMHLTHPDSSAKEEDIINFRLKHQEQIIGLFSDGSLVPSMPTSTNRLALPSWSGRFEALKSFRDMIVDRNQFLYKCLPPPPHMCGLPGIKMNAQIFKPKVAECTGTAQPRVLLEAETRYANVLMRNGIQKLSILVNIRNSCWHSSHQNCGKHYTLRGYNREGWMVVTLEMKVGNAGSGYTMRIGMGVPWHQNTFSELGSMKRYIFAAFSLWTPSVEILFYKLMYDTMLKVAIARHTRFQAWIWMDGIAIIEIPVKDSFVG